MKLTQKLTINKLIANDIINYALDDAICENYIVSLSVYLKDFDNDTQKYIKENIDTIIEDIKQNENVLDLELEREENDITFNFVFYWDKVLDQVGNIIFDNAKLLNVELEHDDVKEIEEELFNDDSIKDKLINYIKSYDNGKEID